MPWAEEEGEEEADFETRVLANNTAGTVPTYASFVIPNAYSPSWDMLGKYLAVTVDPGEVSVYDLAGSQLATINELPELYSEFGSPMMQWHPNGGELWCAGKSDSSLYSASDRLLVCDFRH